MTKQYSFGAILLLCIVFPWSSGSEEKWAERLKERLEKLGEDQDLVNRFPNLTIDIVYFNYSQQDSSTNNRTKYHDCNITDKATRCSKADIFEVAKILPLTTEYLEITNSPVNTLRHSILSNLTSLTHLKLTNNSIHYITSKLFVGLQNLRTLNLSDNKIRSLTKVAFTGCPNVVLLDLARNSIITLMFIPAALAPLQNLSSLSLSGNDIRVIRANDLAVMSNSSSLKKLDLSHCILTRIEKGSLSHLSNLEHLTLRVTHISEEALSNATYNLRAIKTLDLRLLPSLRAFPSEAMMHLANSSIEFIDFSLSEFFFIPSDSFPSLPTLKMLRFFSSMISLIEDGAFSGLTSLELLDLSSNRLAEVPSSLLALTNLSILSLAGQKTKIFDIPDYSLSNLTSLTLLRLEWNPLKDKTLSEPTFYGLRSLVKMTLQGCGVVSIRRHALRSLTSLEYLDLSRNSLLFVQGENFRGLGSLKILILKDNGLILGRNVRPFEHTKSLERLQMARNEIRTLRANHFSGLQNLEHLNLSENKIIPWKDSIFEGNSPKELLLAGNEISHMTPAMFEDLKDVSFVDMSSNPFDCRRCGVDRLHAFLLSYNDSKSSYSCFTPPNLYGHSIFEVSFQLDHCLPSSFSLETRIAVGFSALATFTITLIVGYYFRWYLRYWWFHLHASMKRLSASSDRNAYLYDAFVSYNSADILWVNQKLLPNLENRNSQIRLCLHDRDFEVGRLITENILESIDKSKKVLLVLTSSFMKSEWCLFELHVAQHRLFHDTRDALVLIQVGAPRKEDTTKQLRYLMKTRTLLVWPGDNPEKEEAFWTNLHKILSS